MINFGNIKSTWSVEHFMIAMNSNNFNITLLKKVIMNQTLHRI